MSAFFLPFQALWPGKLAMYVFTYLDLQPIRPRIAIIILTTTDNACMQLDHAHS